MNSLFLTTTKKSHKCKFNVADFFFVLHLQDFSSKTLKRENPLLLLSIREKETRLLKLLESLCKFDFIKIQFFLMLLVCFFVWLRYFVSKVICG